MSGYVATSHDTARADIANASETFPTDPRFHLRIQLNIAL